MINNNNSDAGGSTSMILATIGLTISRAMKNILSLDERDTKVTELLKSIFAAAHDGNVNRSLFTTALANELTGKISG